MRYRLWVFSLAAVILAGCGGHQAVPPPGASGTTSNRDTGVMPDIRQTGEQPVQWRRFGSGGNQYPYQAAIVSGPDGNMWYTDYSDRQLIRMKMTGSTHGFPVSFNPIALTVGADSNFYTGSDGGSQIAVVTTSGVVTPYTIPSGDNASYDGMTKGPDGNVWFAEYAHVGKITPAGVFTEYAYADGDTSNYYGTAVAGPDGNIWATQYYNQKVDKINPSTGAMTSFALTCSPTNIISSSGSLWINCGSSLAQVKTNGTVIYWRTGFSIGTNGTELTVGPDGNPWFATSGSNIIGEFLPLVNSLIFYYPPAAYSNVYGLTTGSDGNVWAADNSGDIDVYIVNVLNVSPSTVSLTGGGQTANITVTEPGNTAWTATSSNASVASVAPNGPPNQFTITSVARGFAKIIVSDAIGNSFVVRVTVR